MDDDAKSEKSDDAPVCSWCGQELSPDEHQAGVCARCVRLLKGAGVPDDEIFGKPEKK